MISFTLFNKEKQGTLKNLAGECYFDLFVIELIISSIPEPTWGWFAHWHLCGGVPTCIYRTACCSPWAGMSQVTWEPGAAALQLLLISHSRRWQVLLGSALGSAVQARCSTALRSRFPSALPVHQGLFIVLPLAWMLGHEQPHAHDPPALHLVQFWPWKELEMTAIKRDCNRALAFAL